MGFQLLGSAFSALMPSQVPEGSRPRWAVLGRSNVGKSSLLNALIHPKKFFRTGSQPGVTRGLIAAVLRMGKDEKSDFEVVDLPGFGFAVAKAKAISEWGSLIEELRLKSQATGLYWLWLADPVRVPGAEEAQLLKWLGQEPFLLVFTKADRCKKKDRLKVEQEWAKIIERSAEKVIWSSADTGEGLDLLQKSARTFLRGWHESM